MIDAFESYKANAEGKGLRLHPIAPDNPDSKSQLLGPNESLEFLGIKMKRDKSENSFWIPKSSRTSIIEQARSSCRLAENDRQARKNWLASSSSKARGLVRDYHSAYGMCEDWQAFSLELRQYQVSMFRKIVDELNRLKKSKDTEALRAVFGA